MADQEEEDLRMAMRMSMQHEPPEPKRSKPRENVVGGGGPVGSPEESRKMQRELMAAAAERRMVAARGAASAAQMAEKSVAVAGQKCMGDSKGKNVELGKELSLAEANQLFLMVFGSAVTRDILAQWSNQGIRFLG
ncbi:hypothetical protein CsSME_00014597 [Camellia sinensis var. sinensis]